MALIVVALLTAFAVTSVWGMRGPTGPRALPHDPDPGLPAEFDGGTALLLGSRNLLNQNRRVLAEIVAAVDDRMSIVVVIDAHEARRGILSYLEDRNVRTHNLRFLEVPIRAVWLRDFGPIFVRGQDRRVYVIDTIYEAAPDGWLPRYIAGYLQLPVLDLPLKLEGGNVLSNGRGMVVLTRSVLEKNAADGLTAEDIRESFQEAIPAEQYVILEPLNGEPTRHADMFVTFVAPDHVVVASIAPEVDPDNARLLDEHAATMANYRVNGRSMRVSRIPMGRHTDGTWRSYNNVVFANGVLLVPQYGVDAGTDAEALSVYRRLLPDWEVVGIDASGLIGKAGSLHCISINVPSGVAVPAETGIR